MITIIVQVIREERAMKYSRQRELILNTVMERPMHPSADDIYSRLKNENPNISLGTVYRNLNQLAEHGYIMRILIAGGCDRFDGRTDEHYHMICESCGQVTDVELNLLNNLDEQIEKETGFVVKKRDLILRGVCSQCNFTAI